MTPQQSQVVAVPQTPKWVGWLVAGLILTSVVAIIEALLILYVRSRVMSERRARIAVMGEALAVPV